MPTMRGGLAHAPAHAAPDAPVPQPRSTSVSTFAVAPGSAIDDVREQQIVERTVEQREGRALAGARERRAFRELLPPLDVGGRQRAQRARHFGKRQLREMLRFERGDPAGESIVGWVHVCEAGPEPRLRDILHAGLGKHLHRFHAEIVHAGACRP